MCVVVPLAATLGMQALSGVTSYIGQRAEANKQAQYNNQVYQQQSQEAIANAEYQNRQVERNNQYILDNAANVQQTLQTDREALVAQQRQEGLATAASAQQRRIERIRATGAIQASERQGLTLDTLLQDFYRQEAEANNIGNMNLAFASGQRVREGDKLTSVAQSRLNDARPYEAAPFQKPYAPAPVSQPSFLGAALGVASGAATTLNSRSVYDSTRGRYVIDTMRPLPTALAPYQIPTRDYTQGFAKNYRIGNTATQGLK